MSNVVVVVDPYEAGALYAPLLAARGMAVHAVLSDPPPAGEERRASFRREDFAIVHGPRADVAALEPRLRPLGVRAVLAGHEHGVEAADSLAAALGVPGNDLATSAARRDKETQAALTAAAGLAIPRSRWGGDADRLMAAAPELGWPVVAKPARGYGAGQVCRCADAGELASALGRIFAEKNALGGRNRRAGVQELLRGRELALDTVSWQGRHRLVALWEYQRPTDDGRGPIRLFDAKELLPLAGDDARRCLPYLERLLDALGVRYGPAHTELMLVGGEPVLIELGARLHGGAAAHALCRHATGTSQVEAMVETLADDALPTGDGRPGARHATMLVLRGPTWADSAAREDLAARPGVAELRWNAPPREAAPEVAGLALLASDDPRDLDVVAAALSPAHGRIPVEVVTADPALAALASAWEGLLARSSCNRTFGSREWFTAWCEVRPELQARVLVARNGGAVTGILPLVETPDGVWRFPGDLADYNDAIVAAGDRRAAVALLAALRREASAFNLTCLRRDSALAGLLDTPPPATVGCPYATLQGGYPAYLATRATGFRNSLKRAWRRAAEAGLEVVEQVANAEAGDAFLDPAALPALFLALHGARFPRSCFDRPLDRAFAEKALPTLFAAGRLRVFAIRRHGEVLGMTVCALGPNSLCNWNGGWRPEASSFAPGKLLLDFQIRAACRENLAEYDLMRGQETYKADWTNASRDIATYAEP